MWATLNTGNYYTETLGNIKGSMFKSQPSWSLLLQDDCQEGSHWGEREYRTRGSSVNDTVFHLGFERWIGLRKSGGVHSVGSRFPKPDTIDILGLTILSLEGLHCALQNA